MTQCLSFSLNCKTCQPKPWP